MLTWGDAVTIHHPMSRFRWMVDVGPDTVMQFAMVSARADGALGLMVWSAWSASEPHRATWAIYPTCEELATKGLPRLMPGTHDESWSEAEPLCHGWVKWDGCMHWWDAGSGMHVDSRDDLADLHAALCEARRMSLRAMVSVRDADIGESD